MTTAALLFISTFVVVLALGLQSLNVNGGHRWMAAVTSFAIGGSNLVLFKLLPGPTTELQIAAYLLGGPVGIVSAMALHPWLVDRLRRKPTIYPPQSCSATAPAPAPPAWRRWEVPRDQVHVVDPLRQLAQDLLDPETLGHAATPEIRQRAARALNP